MLVGFWRFSKTNSWEISLSPTLGRDVIKTMDAKANLCFVLMQGFGIVNSLTISSLLVKSNQSINLKTGLKFKHPWLITQSIRDYCRSEFITIISKKHNLRKLKDTSKGLMIRMPRQWPIRKERNYELENSFYRIDDLVGELRGLEGVAKNKAKYMPTL